MARPSGSSKRDRLRAIPWTAIMSVGLVLGRRVSELSEKDRGRLAQLLRESRGWPWRLAERDRDELRRLIGRLDPLSIGAEMMRSGRRGRKRR